MSTRLLLADNNRIVRQGLCRLLKARSDMDVIGQADTGAQAVALADSLTPDVIITETDMPEMNGLEAARAILTHCPDVRIIALSGRRHPAVITEMLASGVSGYLHKNCRFDEVVLAVQTVLVNQTYLGLSVTQEIVDQCVPDGAGGGLRSTKRLSNRERSILTQLADGKSAKETAFALKLSVKTVEAYRRQIMEKLDRHSVAELTKYAILHGLTHLHN